MSNLAGFTATQMEEGLKELDQTYRNTDTLDFVDNHIFITGIK